MGGREGEAGGAVGGWYNICLMGTRSRGHCYSVASGGEDCMLRAAQAGVKHSISRLYEIRHRVQHFGLL